MLRLPCFLLLMCVGTLSAQNTDITEYLSQSNFHVFNSDIHTLKIGTDNIEWSQPVITLGSGDKILCSFDDFNETAKDYRYTFVHCTPDWKITTGINQNEYMTGYYAEEMINDYKQSFNTLRNFIHYSFTFPSENINIGLSGNYALVVYEDNVDNPIFVARFYVVENVTTVPVYVDFTRSIENINKKQRVAFSINAPEFDIKEPYRSLTVVVQQNDKPFLQQGNVQPKYISGNTFNYDFDDKFEFNGNYEFRHVDLRSVKFLTPTNSDIIVDHSEYYVFTHDVDPWNGKTYSSRNDIDGQFFVYSDNNDVDTESEYAFVNLHVKSPFPMSGEEVYVCGDFNGWQLNDDNKMVYNHESGEYEKTLYLKQGYYDYTYIRLNRETMVLDETFVDGTFNETQNRYSVFVYYNPSDERYCRLIGYGFINTRNHFIKH